MIIPPAPSNDTALVVRRIFAAPRQRVFRAWVEPKALESWLKPGNMAMSVSRLELRVGGSFCFELENGHCVLGTYLQVTPPEKLIFTWTGDAIQRRETIVTVEFLDRGALTEVVLTHEQLSTPQMRAMFSSGWPSLLDVLAELL